MATTIFFLIILRLAEMAESERMDGKNLLRGWLNLMLMQAMTRIARLELLELSLGTPRASSLQQVTSSLHTLRMYFQQKR
jgi:hypothetical protein